MPRSHTLYQLNELGARKCSAAICLRRPYCVYLCPSPPSVKSYWELKIDCGESFHTTEMGYRSEFLFFLSFFLEPIVKHLPAHHWSQASVVFKDPQVVPMCSRVWEAVLVFAYAVLSVVSGNLVSLANSRNGYLRLSPLSNLGTSREGSL